MTSERLTYRPVTLATVVDFHALVQDDHVRRYLMDGQLSPVGESEQRVRDSVDLFARRGVGLWLAYETRSGELAGFCGFLEIASVHPQPQLIYALFERFTGIGYATEMALASIAEARRHAGFETIVAGVDEVNVASVRVLEKLGFRRAATYPGSFGTSLLFFSNCMTEVSNRDLVVLFEHPEWQKPLFSALERRGIAFEPFDLKRAAFSNVDAPTAAVFFNQASPSAYVRGNTRAVPLALAYMRTLERLGARVLNGADVFALELSKSAQATLLRTLGIDTPRSITFNDVAALGAYADSIQWPALLKPDQGGSGARIQVVESLAHVESIFAADPGAWQPDNLFLLQEYLPHDPEQGIVRLEFLGGELLYAMRVKTHGRFNLCPSPVCNPGDGDGMCEIPAPDAIAVPPVEFYPYRDVPPEAVETAAAIVRAAGLDVGGIEYLETPDGRRVFYDINANSNLRPAIGEAFGFDPFDRVVTFLSREVEKSRSNSSAPRR